MGWFRVPSAAGWAADSNCQDTGICWAQNWSLKPSIALLHACLKFSPQYLPEGSAEAADHHASIMAVLLANLRCHAVGMLASMWLPRQGCLSDSEVDSTVPSSRHFISSKRDDAWLLSCWPPGVCGSIHIPCPPHAFIVLGRQCCFAASQRIAHLAPVVGLGPLRVWLQSRCRHSSFCSSCRVPAAHAVNLHGPGPLWGLPWEGIAVSAALTVTDDVGHRMLFLLLRQRRGRGCGRGLGGSVLRCIASGCSTSILQDACWL